MRIKTLACNVFLFTLASVATSSCVTTHTRPVDFSIHAGPIDRTVKYPVHACAAELKPKPEGVELKVKHQSQDVDYVPPGKAGLCWAADISMISTYLGDPRVTCQIASYEPDDGKSCCRLTLESPPADIERCNRGSGKVSEVLGRIGIYHIYSTSVLTEDQIKTELANGRPIMAHTENPRTEDGKAVLRYHVFLISGYTSDMYHVLNSNRSSSDSLTYDQLLHGDHEKWTWDTTWYRFSFRQDGCNPRFRQDCDVCK